VTYVLYLDRYHLGDPLFLTRLARDLLARDESFVLVHGPGEGAERALEADGSVARWRGTVLETADDHQEATVAMAARSLNRSIAGALTEAGVAAIRVDGDSRGLLASDPAGAVRPGNADWLGPLVASGVVPVVAALTTAGGAVRQLPAGAVLAALAEALGASVLLLARGEAAIPDPLLPADAAARLAEPEAASGALAAGVAVFATSPRGLGRGEIVLSRLAE
jgi:acetylglutamate kinase